MRWRHVAAVGTLTSLSVGMGACGSDETKQATGASSSGAAASSSGGDAPIPCDAAPEQLALGGTWAAFGRLAISFVGSPGGAITICPVDQIGEATMMLLITIADEPAGATTLTEVHAALCSVELPVVTALVGDCNPSSEGLLSTQISAPAKLIEALPSVASEPVGATLDGLAKGATVTMDRLHVTVGSTKQDSELPAWDASKPGCAASDLGHGTTCEAACVDDCAAVRDDDGDGYPGVTFEVCGFTSSDQSAQVTCNATSPSDPGATLQGTAFIDIQVDPIFKGTVQSSCEIEGAVDTSVLYNVLGADLTLAGGALSVASAIMSLPAFQVDSANSKFGMIRVDGRYGAPDWGIDPSSVGAACAIVNAHVNDF